MRPQLWLSQDELDAGAPVPQVDLVWHVHLPTGYRVSRVHGSVFSSDVEQPKSPWRALTQAGRKVGGGIHGPPMQMLALSAKSPAATAMIADAEMAGTEGRPQSGYANRDFDGDGVVTDADAAFLMLPRSQNDTRRFSRTAEARSSGMRQQPGRPEAGDAADASTPVLESEMAGEQILLPDAQPTADGRGGAALARGCRAPV